MTSELTADPQEVGRFLGIVHEAAERSLAGAFRPGMLQLVNILPLGGRPIIRRFPIGDVETMAKEACLYADAGYNVYVEARTVDERTSGRGREAATRGVFGLVVDADADKGMAGATIIEPSFVVETSPGNAHRWIFLDRALSAEAAKPLGQAIRAAVGADFDTGTLTQPYRVAGTPNLVGPKKAARGRVSSPTRILEHSGRIWSARELAAAFPRVERVERTHAGPTGRSGRASAEVEDLVAEAGTDRSGRFHAAVVAALAAGLTPDDLEALMRAHPEGCAGKYLHPYDRLAQEIARSWSKAQDRAERQGASVAEPTHPDASQPVDDARRAVTAAIDGFLAAAEAFAPGDEAEPPVHAVAVSTGVGKTRIAAQRLAERIKAEPLPGSVIYCVPTHRLGSEIEALFREHGVRAKVFRGRQALDPERPGETMCDDLEAVEAALALGATVSTSCCKGEAPNGIEARCAHFATCAYQRQMLAGTDVWIVAHQLLFQAQAALGKAALVVIDEGFWQAGMRIPKRGLTLDEIAAPLGITTARLDYLVNDVEVFRGRLARALRRQPLMGGIERCHLVAGGLEADTCTAAIAAEWRLKGKAALWPGMPRRERQRAAQAADEARHAKAFTGVWGAARDLLFLEDAATVSGRLYLEARDGEEGRVTLVKARGIKGVAKQWRVPTLILDATLPAPEILRAYHPQVEVTAQIEAAAPHVTVRQVLGAPVSARKLALGEDGSAGRNLRAIRREVLRRHLEVGRGRTLVVAQKAAADWLRGTAVPPGVFVEHFNNVAGLDQYRDVRLLMVIGRTLPSPAAVEALAGALTGREPAKVAPWYAKAVRGIRTRGEGARAVECDAHPDPVAEACRWQVCEGELMQALGRARGVNRTPETPLAIDVLADVCLPMGVDAVEVWKAPGEEVEMMAEGVVLDGGADMSAAWPEVWPTAKAAEHWAARRRAGNPHSPPNAYREEVYKGIWGAVRFRYQRPGPRQKWRTGAYDPAVVPDLRAWLTSRLGPLAGFDIPENASAPPRADWREAAE